ncbi:uracil-DNA glycosylase [Candidatus Babeliales bacterium]|nr:uracil-DNA glycosylase [Candidatus Babeliales bacterium]
MKKNKEIEQYINHLEKQPKGFLYEEKKDNLSQIKMLYQPYRNCTKCPLGQLGRTQVVFGEGNPNSNLMFIGEGPGRNEDKQGHPFVGRAGQVFDKIIEAMNIKRDEIWISNVVKCRPPNNRVPLPQESSKCTELMLFREIEIIKPKIICTLGATATQALLGPNAKLSQVRGQIQKYKKTLVVPTYHPAYLLRNPAQKKKVWQDMQQILKILKI